MKYLITEEQYKRLVSENRFQSQEEVDAILDKINDSGYESLTSDEKHILKNPDEKIEQGVSSSDEAEEIIFSNDIMAELISKGFINPHDIMILENNTFQINLMGDDDGNLFKYFQDGNSIKLTTHIDGGELLVEADDESDPNDKSELMEYIKEIWESALGIPVFVDGIDF